MDSLPPLVLPGKPNFTDNQFKINYCDFFNYICFIFQITLKMLFYSLKFSLAWFVFDNFYVNSLANKIALIFIEL